MKARLDVLLAERGLAESREKAQALVLAGEVLVNGIKARKAGQSVPDSAVLEVLQRPAHVSRGGRKLEAAIDHLEFEPEAAKLAELASLSRTLAAPRI